MKNLVQKSIRFPAKAVEIIDQEVRSTLGIDFNEYLKVHVVTKAERIQNKHAHTSQLVAEIEQTKKDVKNGKVPVLRTNEDIDKFFDALDHEDL